MQSACCACGAKGKAIKTAKARVRKIMVNVLFPHKIQQTSEWLPLEVAALNVTVRKEEQQHSTTPNVSFTVV